LLPPRSFDAFSEIQNQLYPTEKFIQEPLNFDSYTRSNVIEIVPIHEYESHSARKFA